MRCGSSSTSPARISAASTASAAPAPCWSTASRSGPASPMRWIARRRRCTTIEGFDGDATMAALRQAFTEHHALQCGFCTPGMLVSARDIVLRLGEVDEARLRAGACGQSLPLHRLCRHRRRGFGRGGGAGAAGGAGGRAGERPGGTGHGGGGAGGGAGGAARWRDRVSRSASIWRPPRRPPGRRWRICGRWPPACPARCWRRWRASG